MARINYQAAPSLSDYERGKFALRTPYDREFNNRMKDLVPQGAREWDPAEHVWVIDDCWAVEVYALCQEVFGGVRDDRT